MSNLIGTRVTCIMGSHVNSKGTVIDQPNTGRVIVQFDGDNAIRTYNAPGTLGAGVVKLRGARPRASQNIVIQALYKKVKNAARRKGLNTKKGRMYVSASAVGTVRKMVPDFWLKKHAGKKYNVIAETATRYQLQPAAPNPSFWAHKEETLTVRIR